MVDADSNFDLGERYFNGQGVVKSYETAIEYYKKADAQGHELATIAVAWMYNFGEGVEQSHETAQYYFNKAKGGVEEQSEERFPNFPTIIR